MPLGSGLVDEYDAIIVGASFAGLAVARELHGRILLIDREEIGEGQTSACGTPLRVVDALGLTSSETIGISFRTPRPGMSITRVRPIVV